MVQPLDFSAIQVFHLVPSLAFGSQIKLLSIWTHSSAFSFNFGGHLFQEGLGLAIIRAEEDAQQANSAKFFTRCLMIPKVPLKLLTTSVLVSQAPAPPQ